MSWSALKTDAAQIKVREAQLFADYSDADAQGIMLAIALDDLKRDVADALSLPLDSTEFDTLAVEYATDLKKALAYRQLYLWFVDQDAGEGSVNRYKADHYFSLYNQERQRFKTMGDYATSRSVRVTTAWR